MSKGLKKVRPEDYDKETLWAAAQEGRLYIEEPENTCKESVIHEVRQYVKQLHPFVNSRFRDHVDDIWEQIFACDELTELLIPSTKARKFKAFNKYNVMRIIGVLRNAGVYQVSKDLDLVAQLEHTDTDNSYRGYIGKGVEQRALLRKILEIADSQSLSQGNFFS